MHKHEISKVEKQSRWIEMNGGANVAYCVRTKWPQKVLRMVACCGAGAVFGGV